MKNSQLKYYLAGLIEGDGNIWTPKNEEYLYKYKYNPRIEIAFHRKEIPLFEHLKSVLNTGSIYPRKTNLGCTYTISNLEKVIEIISLVNGKFRTPKIIYLHRAIDYINIKYNLNIEKLPLDKSNLNSNAWLAGMTDADGNFTINLAGKYAINNSLSKNRVKCIYSIKQRIIDKATKENCIPFMANIANLFQCNINQKSPNIIGFFAQANNKHYLVKSYFDNYPLMTSKYLDYLCFLEGLNYLGKSLTNEEISEVQTIKNAMNNKRIYYNWDHLSNLL